MEKRGQGALEYLLLIGGAVLIAVIVIAVITGLGTNTANNVNIAATCAVKSCDQCKIAVGCAGFNAEQVRTFTGAVGAGNCTAGDAAAFAICKQA